MARPSQQVRKAKTCYYLQRFGANREYRIKLRSKVKDIATQVHSSTVFSVTGGMVESFIRLCLISHDGRLRTTRYLPWYFRRPIANHFAYRDWTQIALAVANQFPGGDYFEFGSEGFRTLRNFLSAFHLNGHADRFPDTKFFAFDLRSAKAE
jgi:hypothetical protein